MRPASRKILKCWERVDLGKVRLRSLRNLEQIMTNKTFLITGGTTGIGLATVQLLRAEGAKVVVTGRNPETLAAAKKILTGVVVHPSDAGDLAAAQALGEEVKKICGSPRR